MTYRLHVVSLPHLATNKQNCACAYTQKVLNFAKMMTEAGHDVMHYGVEGSDVICSEDVVVSTQADVEAVYGKYDYKTQLPDQLVWDGSHIGFMAHNTRTALEIRKRQKPRDFLCLISGTCQWPIHDMLNRDANMLTVEYGIGYDGICSRFRVYESYAHMAKHYGIAGFTPSPDWYHVVIPNYYDVDDFPLHEEKEDYCLFIGRMISTKGIDIAIQATEAAGCKLLLAGQGVTDVHGHTITTAEKQYFGRHLEYVGHADVQRRAELMGRARAVLVPTNYLEPFGGVAVEAQLCGTPAITTDWGAFPETVRHGFSGYRCRTIEQFTWAIKNADCLATPEMIRHRAVANWGLEHVSLMYQEYFQMVYDLWEAVGWNTARPERTQLAWLNKE